MPSPPEHQPEGDRDIGDLSGGEGRQDTSRHSESPSSDHPEPDATVVAPRTEGPGTVIGRYKILQQIGEGGFGVVYMTEQREPVERMVALKIIKLGMDTKQVIARFEVWSVRPWR